MRAKLVFRFGSTSNEYIRTNMKRTKPLPLRALCAVQFAPFPSRAPHITSNILTGACFAGPILCCNRTPPETAVFQHFTLCTRQVLPAVHPPPNRARPVNAKRFTNRTNVDFHMGVNELYGKIFPVSSLQTVNGAARLAQQLWAYTSAERPASSTRIGGYLNWFCDRFILRNVCAQRITWNTI